MRSKEIEEKARSLKLTSIQRDLLVGTMLGDGHLETQNQGRTYRLRIEHSIQQREYVGWFYHMFQAWVRTAPTVRSRKVIFRGVKKTFKRIGFSTLSSGSLRFYAGQFYQGRKKSVPKLIHRWLTPRAIAVWYMDDGSIKSKQHRSILFNTHSFSEKDLKRLQIALERTYSIKTKVRKQKDGNQLYCVSETVDILLALIRPFVIPSMEYKLPKVWLTSLPKK